MNTSPTTMRLQDHLPIIQPSHPRSLARMVHGRTCGINFDSWLARCVHPNRVLMSLGRVLWGLFLLFRLGAEEPAGVPRPASVRAEVGTFVLRAGTGISGPADLRPMVERWTRHFAPGQFRWGGRGIRLELDHSVPTTGHRLSIRPAGIQIRAASAEGLFHGLQTLRQMAGELEEASKPGMAKLQAMVIEDAPRFSWRGLHLDVSRHFYTVAEIKQVLEWMARFKLNTFHWHLTDTGGWRLEIRAFPKLTSIAAWRVPGEPWNQDQVRFPGGDTRQLYGGFYTQAEAREIVRYAAERHITVVPEIEIPGHQIPVFEAYPELQCEGLPRPATRTWRSSEFCVGRESTFRFLEQVLTEVLEIFPAPVIHIGGDEVDPAAWRACPHCQARMRSEGLASPKALEAWTVARIGRWLADHGRRMIGWDEITEGGLPPDAMVMHWRPWAGTAAVEAAARQGHRIVMATGDPLYLDQPESTRPMAKVYAFEPLPKGLSGTAHERNVVGVEACIWTEWMPDFQAVQRMVWPRLAAVAETAWTLPERKDWAHFQGRLPAVRAWMRRAQIASH